MQKVLTYILSDEFSTVEVLKLYCSEFEILDLQPTNNIEEILVCLNSSQNKSVVIVDLSSDKDIKTDFISKISALSSNCNIIALCDNPSVNLIVEAMRSGAKEFLPVPIIKNEFSDCMNNILGNKEKDKKNKCKIISVFK